MGSRLQEKRRGDEMRTEERMWKGREGKGWERSWISCFCPNCGNRAFLRHTEGGCSSFYIKRKVNFMSHKRGRNTVMLA